METLKQFLLIFVLLFAVWLFIWLLYFVVTPYGQVPSDYQQVANK